MTTRESKKSSGGKTTSRNTKSSFDVIELGQAEKKFAIPKNEMDAANKGGYTLTKPHRKKLRLSQNFK